jgi:2-polyprenyl-3-methyl-5-hydroxy-6-metoxy-1,4-benzoquinol methylase
VNDNEEKMTNSNISFKKSLILSNDFHVLCKPFLPLSKAHRGVINNFNSRVKDKSFKFESIPCLCGNITFDSLALVDRYSMLQQTVICTKCGLIQSNPRMTQESYSRFYSSDMYRKCYDFENFENKNKYEEIYTIAYGKDIFNEINKIRHIDRSIAVLEFGAGGGWNLLPFTDKKANVLGIDYSPALVKLGKNHGIPMVMGGIDEVHGRFDVIIINHVLEHILDPVVFLKKITKHLNNNALVYISVPNILNFGIRQIQNAHTYYFTFNSLQYYCSKANLQMVKKGIADRVHLFEIFKLSKKDDFEQIFLKKYPNFLKDHSKMMYSFLRRHKLKMRLKILIKKVLIYLNLYKKH